MHVDALCHRKKNHQLHLKQGLRQNAILVYLIKTPQEHCSYQRGVACFEDFLSTLVVMLTLQPDADGGTSGRKCISLTIDTMKA